MPSMLRLSRLAFFCLLLLPGMAVSADVIPPLKDPPTGQQWFGVFMGDERAGFSHLTTRPVPGGYEVTSDSSTKMTVLGFSREAFSKERYTVNADLSLQAFAVEQVVGGKAMRLKGELTAKGAKVVVEAGGSRKEKTLKTGGKVYSAPLLNLSPLMQGGTKGKKYRLQILDIEEVKLKPVTVVVIGMETLPGEGPALHLRNDLYRVVDNDIWLDLAGRTTRESVRDDLIVTRAEDGEPPGKSVLAAAIAKAEWIVDFSLVSMDKAISQPGELKRMAVELCGIPEGMPLLSGERQHAVRANGSVLFTMESSPAPTTAGTPGTDMPAGNDHAASAVVTTPENEELIAVKNDILGDEKDPIKAMQKLAVWVASTVADSPADDHSPLETLKVKKGNCQSRVRLYNALASAAGLSTRAVTGLAYFGKGFLYHSWAETFAGEWLTVDPTLGQVPADATHIKLAEGELSPAQTTTLAEIVGHVKAKLVEERY